MNDPGKLQNGDLPYTVQPRTRLLSSFYSSSISKSHLHTSQLAPDRAAMPAPERPNALQ
jgi:hypothetical protein